MKKYTVIAVLLFVAIFVVARVGVPSFVSSTEVQSESEDTLLSDTVISLESLEQMVADGVFEGDSSLVKSDSLDVDSVMLAIKLHNKAVDDSLRLDSINRRRKNGIDAPVVYSGNDSLIYIADSKTAHIFGSAKVDYQDMKLESEYIHMSLDSSLVRAEGAVDSLGEKSGTPVFNMGSDSYESDKMTFNFKTKKGLINQVYTQQQDGYMTAQLSKRDSSGVVYMQKGTYTTCDDPHPDFYIALSRAKVRPGKDVVFGPAHLVVADVPLPLAIPYGFFPFTTSNFSSGFIMPTYGDETSRGFYLKDGGYYFAISDRIDLKLLGEIYTKGSWGFSAASNYKKRYKFRGSFFFSYLNTKTGDKGLPDFAEEKSFKIQWQHSQDSKANPYNSTLSANVNFANSSYEQSSLTSMYNPQAKTQSTRTSSVSWGTSFSSLGLTLSSTFNLSQNMRDSSLAVTLPDLNISVARFYPFKRKNGAGKERWYEKISMSYTGHISNSITAKESEFLNKSLVKDWRNGWQHNIPISGSFSLFDVINVSPSFNFNNRTYMTKTMKSWDGTKEVSDTLRGFYNVYNWNLSLSASTEIYGFYVPSRKIFGDKIDRIRHVFKPNVSFSYAPDFADPHYGFWKTYERTNADGTVEEVPYSPYANNLYGTAPQGKSGSIAIDISNNIEMKIKSEKDTTGFKKISIIDELGAAMSYNMAAKERPLSDLQTRLRLKWWKSYTFNLNAVFATYAYELDKDGKPRPSNRTEYSFGRFGRFQGMSQNFSYTLTPDKLKSLFSGKKDDDDDDKNKNKHDDEDDDDIDIESNIDKTLNDGQKNKSQGSGGKAETDADGYLAFSMPWSLTVGYGISMREDTGGEFNTSTMRYPYKFTQTLNFSGYVQIASGWNIQFSSGYDFDYHKLSMTTASLNRDLHCFNMSCSVVIAPYTAYNFSFRCNAATLTDALKYDKRSGMTNNIKWY